MDTMTPSKDIVGMTDGQIDKAADALRAEFVSGLREHRAEFGIDATQRALGAKGLIVDMLKVFQGYVESFSDTIVRIVRPNRRRTPQLVIDMTGRRRYTNEEVVASMPCGVGDEVRVVFFKPNRRVNAGELEMEYKKRGLKPADPYSLAKVNEDDPAFSDKYPNATQWKNIDDEWCFAAFAVWYAKEPYVRVNNDGSIWNEGWWFAGLEIEPRVLCN